MKITLPLIEKLQRLARGEKLPFSSISIPLMQFLMSEGVIDRIYRGGWSYLRVTNVEAFLGVLPKYNEALCNLDAAKELLMGDGSRAAQASLSGNSKTRSERTCPGFLVNSYHPMVCKLQNRSFMVDPVKGSAIYISDWQSFVPPASAVIIGVENMENFLRIREQKLLFESCLKPIAEAGSCDVEDLEILFVARYAFSSDLMHWLARLPNRYVHFGDFDLAGIDIYLTQFKPHVGERGRFLIPADIEERIKNGSRQRYDEQYVKYASIAARSHSLISEGTPDSELHRLIALINRQRRTYDQEGYIGQQL